MRLHIRNFLAIVPLFVFLALVGGALLERAAREQLRWDAEEEGRSLAVATAEFLAAQRGAIPEAPLERLLRAGQARRFVLLSPDRSRVLLALPAVSSVPEPDRLTAWASIPDGRGILGVETDGRRFRVEQARLRRQALGLGGVIVLVGVVVALGISAGIARDVRALTRTAQEVGREDRVLALPPGRIREIADLGGTFLTMHALLGEVQARARRAQNVTPTRDDLARRYRQIVDEDLDRTLAGVRVLARSAGEDPASFHLATSLPDGGACALAGRVEDRGDPLETAAEASAARAFLERQLPRHGAGAGLFEATERFSFACLDLVEWGPGASNPRCRDTGSAGRAVDLPYALVSTLSPLPPVHSHRGERVLHYLARFAYLPPEELIDDLEAIVADEARGSLMIVCPATEHKAEAA